MYICFSTLLVLKQSVLNVAVFSANLLLHLNFVALNCELQRQRVRPLWFRALQLIPVFIPRNITVKSGYQLTSITTWLPVPRPLHRAYYYRGAVLSTWSSSFPFPISHFLWQPPVSKQKPQNHLAWSYSITASR